MKNKNLYNIIIFTLIIIVVYGFSFKKVDELSKPEELIIQEKITEEIKAEVIERYILTNKNTLVPENILNKNKVVLLTIDDGPSKRTKDILEILKKHDAKAIFFINGMYEKNNKGTIELIQKEGFVVGNHTWSHLNLKKEKNTDIIEKEINKNTELINKLTGVKPRFFRAPYGESTPFVRKFVKDNGMISMNWSGSVIDWDKSTIEKDVFIGNAMKNLGSGSIILIHEHPWSVENLDGLLTTFEKNGYTYVDPNNIIEKNEK